jgi:hypothetical protein
MLSSGKYLEEETQVQLMGGHASKKKRGDQGRQRRYNRPLQ